MPSPPVPRCASQVRARPTSGPAGAPAEPSSITNLEGSRRFIVVPWFAALLSLGRSGYAGLVEGAIRLGGMSNDGRGQRWYEVLNLTHEGKDSQMTILLNAVLFRARTAWTRPTLQSDHCN